MYITQECGQRWYRLRSWRGKKFRKLYYYHYVNTGPYSHRRTKGRFLGIAIGPIMIFKGKRDA